jgi:UPF0755 protein
METRGRKPPQVKFDSDNDVRIENVSNRGGSNSPPKYNAPIQHEVESEAAFFASENARVTQQLDAIKSEPSPSVPVQSNNPLPRRAPYQGLPKSQELPSLQELPPSRPRRKPKSVQAMSQAMAEKKKKAIKKRLKRKHEQIRTFSHILGSVLLTAFVLTVSAFLSQFIVRAFLDFTGITVAEFQVTIQIPTDAATEEIADILYGYDIIDMPGLFTFYSRISDSDGNYLHGLFNLSSTMSYSQIVHTLQNRPRSTEIVEVKIIEGMTAKEIAELLEANFVCRAEDFMQFYRNKMNLYNFERRLENNPLKFNQLEGYLFPDTHEFFVVNGLEEDPDMDTSRYAEVAARTIFSHFNTQITPEMYRRIADIGETLDIQFGLDEFMTIASMVQLEAADPEDMRRVASVFFNRLRNPENFPRLESDVARELYGRNNILPYRTGYNEVLLNGMILAYNTYESDAIQNGRLVSPPGPVCNPGMAAILATLDAASTNYFYFCANIETGEVFFAETINGHNENEIRAGIRDSNGALIVG